MGTKFTAIYICCEALKERLDCNNWQGIYKYKEYHVLNKIDIYSFCPFCGKKITEV